MAKFPDFGKRKKIIKKEYEINLINIKWVPIFSEN